MVRKRGTRPRLEGGTGHHPEPPGPRPGKFLRKILQNLFLPKIQEGMIEKCLEISA